ncbi:hypothetical protein ACPF7I_01860 [Anoxybacillus sp. D401a]|uniref:hypothetical protein n=1 Tax=Anoxybacillus sp. D401a TaxID=575112 RepID=UPI003D3321CB
MDLFSYLPSEKFTNIINEYAGTYVSPNILKQQIQKYLKEIEKETLQNEFINLPLAKKIASVCLLLLDVYDQYNEEEKKFINATINYFLHSHDDEEDLYSPLGFDDDAEILNECLRLLKKEDLTIEIE